MINHNGEILDGKQLSLPVHNRALNYGDSLFETVKYTHGKVLWWESHYFRLMGSMRILRMEIPQEYTPEYLEQQMLETVKAAHFEHGAARIKLLVYREGAGKYTPETREVSFIIQVEALPFENYEINEGFYEVELFKDYQKPKGLLSNLKTGNSMLYVLAAIYRQENAFQEVLLLNTENKLVEACSSNIFLLKGDNLKTPPLESGCLKGIMRQNVVKWAASIGLKVEEVAPTPFELLQADELWLTNAIHGIQAASLYRKHAFKNEKAKEMLALINEKAAADESTFAF